MSVSSDSSISARSDSARAATRDRAAGLSQAVVGAPRITPTDGELLTLFTRHDDREALDRLVDRHAAMVWRVCRATLRRSQDAEDAFQATFLLLVKNARRIKSSDSAASWLYRVAYRTSLRARKKQAARREESLAVDPNAPGEAAFPDLLKRQTTGVLVEELMRLPAKYQTPLVMRYLEGQSRRAIADQTDTTIAAVQGQLARGKQMLRHRLLRRGVSLAGAMAALGLGARGAKAAETAPAHLVAQTTSNSMALTSGGSLAASAAMVSLYQQGTRAMLMAWLGKPAASIAAAAVVALMLLPNAPAGEGAVPRSAQPLMLDLAIDEDLTIDSNAAPIQVAQAIFQPSALAAGEQPSDTALDKTASPRRQSGENPQEDLKVEPTKRQKIKGYAEQSIKETLLRQLAFITGARVELNALVDRASTKVERAEASIVIPLSYAEQVFRHEKGLGPEVKISDTALKGQADRIKAQVEEIAQPLLPRLDAGEDEYKQVRVTFVRDLAGSLVKRGANGDPAPPTAMLTEASTEKPSITDVAGSLLSAPEIPLDGSIQAGRQPPANEAERLDRLMTIRRKIAATIERRSGIVGHDQSEAFVDLQRLAKQVNSAIRQVLDDQITEDALTLKEELALLLPEAQRRPKAESAKQPKPASLSKIEKAIQTVEKEVARLTKLAMQTVQVRRVENPGTDPFSTDQFGDGAVGPLTKALIELGNEQTNKANAAIQRARSEVQRYTKQRLSEADLNENPAAFAALLQSELKKLTPQLARLSRLHDGATKSLTMPGYARERLAFDAATGTFAQPVVERSDPLRGEKPVDPSLPRVFIRFSRDMDTGGYSFTGNAESGMPEVPEGKKPKWLNKRTCVLPVKLEPGRAYRIGINSPSHKNFKSADGVPAAIDELRFTTAKATNDSSASPRRQSREDQPASPPTTGVAGSPATAVPPYGPLHVVGTYSGNDGAPLTVEVKPTDEPITLVLSAYYWQDWKLKLQPGAKLARVIVAGYNAQQIEGVSKALPEGVPLDVYTYFNEDKTNNKGKETPHFWAYKKTSQEYFDLVEKLKQITGREVVSFTGASKTDHLVIDPKRLKASRRRQSSEESPATAPPTGVGGSPSDLLASDLVLRQANATKRPNSRISHEAPFGGGGQKGGVNTVIHGPSDLNPFGWTSIGHVAAGGTIPILLPDDKRPRPVLRYRGGGTDDWLPLHVDAEGTPRHSERFQLKRDEPRLEQISGQHVQVWYRSIPAENPSTSPYALVIVRGIPAEKLAEVKAGKLAAPSAKEALERVYKAQQRNHETVPVAGGGGALRSRSPRAVDTNSASPGASLTGSPPPPIAPPTGVGGSPTTLPAAALSPPQPSAVQPITSPKLQTVAKPTDKPDISQAGIRLTPRDATGDKRPSIAYGGRNATYGYSVGQLQERLNEVLDPSPGLDVDGGYGPLTEAAVKRFQKQASLPESGFADELTRDALGFIEPGDAEASRRRQSSEEPAEQAGPQATDKTPTSGADDSPPDELLAKLRSTATYQAAPPGVQKQLEERLEKEASEAERRRLGEVARFVVGRLHLKRDEVRRKRHVKPEQVVAQMVILPGGYFLDLIGDVERPIGFRVQSYDPLDAKVPEGVAPIIDLGELVMSPSADIHDRTLKVSLVNEGGKPVEASFVLRVARGPINTPSNGYDPGAARGTFYDNPGFRISRGQMPGFSPIAYHFQINALGYVSQSRRLDFSNQQTIDLGEIVLEKPKAVELEYVVYRYDDARDPQVRFDEADVGELLDPKRVTLKPGEKFVSDPEKMQRGSSDFRIEQKNGKLTFRSSYGPFYSTDLGEESFASYARTTRVPLTARDNPEILDNHLYLLRSGYFDHYVLVRARVLKPGGEKMSEIDRLVERYNAKLDAAEAQLEQSNKLSQQAESTKSEAVRKALMQVATQKAETAIQVAGYVQEGKIERLITQATEEATTGAEVDVERLEKALKPITKLAARSDELTEAIWRCRKKLEAGRLEEKRERASDRLR